ncbi:MAG: hypothetical protein N3D76_06395 [Geminocystis sp.]|nr:hypothetical protein [Geminocystis sp.]HIK37192.1 hypothetical protein [Geminocystis sp. M7585_C2015_104]
MKPSILFKLLLQTYAYPREATHKGANHKGDEKGFTLLEALVASIMGAIVVVLGLEGYMQIRRLIAEEHITNDVQQRLRIAMINLGQDIQQAGELLPDAGTLNAIEIGGTNNTLLVVRKGIPGVNPQMIQSCVALNANTFNMLLVAHETGCSYRSPGEIDRNNNTIPDVLETWEAVRRGRPEGKWRIYILDRNNNRDQFFVYARSNQSTAASVHPGGTSNSLPRIWFEGQWQNDYAQNNTWVYAIEERRYRLRGNSTDGFNLELIVNGDNNNPFTLVERIRNINVTANPPANGTNVRTNCDRTSFTVTIEALPPRDVYPQVLLGWNDTRRREKFTLQQTFVPRNYDRCWFVMR